MNVKLLLDENISPKVAAVLRREGIDACGVRDRGLLEATDPEVFDKAFAEERIVVTVNVGEFEKLARVCELHAGVVLIERGDLLRGEQAEVVRHAVAAIAQPGDKRHRAGIVEQTGAAQAELQRFHGECVLCSVSHISPPCRREAFRSAAYRFEESPNRCLRASSSSPADCDSVCIA